MSLRRRRRAAKQINKHERNPGSQTFLDHLNELRSRLVIATFALVGGSVIGYMFQDRIATILLSPLRGEKLVYLTPTGGFDFIFSISLSTGIFVAIPVAIHQLYYFLAPLIKEKQTRRFAAFVIILSGALAITGMVFGYFIILPGAIGS